MTDPVRMVYASCPTCKGVVFASAVDNDADAGSLAAKIHAQGFFVLDARQEKIFAVGYRLKAGCLHAHEFTA